MSTNEDFLKALACELARQGIETWQDLNSSAPMEQGEQAYLLYQLSLYLQSMNADAVQKLVERPF